MSAPETWRRIKDGLVRGVVGYRCVSCGEVMVGTSPTCTSCGEVKIRRKPDRCEKTKTGDVDEADLTEG